MRELDFDTMHLFARVAELGTLSGVARERDVPVSQVSRAPSRIEKSCGIRLIHRSTHGLSLTAEGETFLESCRHIARTLDELEGEFARQSGEASGRVRVAARPVRLGIIWNCAITDLTVPIRRATTVSGKGSCRCGSRCRCRRGPCRPAGRLPASPPSALDAAPDTNVVANLVLQGMGIGRLTTITAEPLVREGRLVRVLEQCNDALSVPIFAMTPGTRHRLSKIKACLHWWTEWFAQVPLPLPATATTATATTTR